MKRSELIKQLMAIPGEDPEVCLYDHKKNLGDDIGEGSSEGIHSDFEVFLYTLPGEDEEEDFKERNEREFVPWIAIAYDNDDYDDNGRSVWEEYTDEEREELQKRSFWELPPMLAFAAALALFGGAFQIMRLSRNMELVEYVCTILVSILLIYNGIRFVKQYFDSEDKARNK